MYSRDRPLKREDLNERELLCLMTIVGATKVGDWFGDLDDVPRTMLLRKGIVFTSAVSLSPSSMPDRDTRQFHLTGTGKEYLRLWTFPELLDLLPPIKSDSSPFPTAYPRAFLATRAPKEFLPEFLAHPNEDVRNCAEERLRMLINEKSSY